MVMSEFNKSIRKLEEQEQERDRHSPTTRNRSILAEVVVRKMTGIMTVTTL